MGNSLIHAAQWATDDKTGRQPTLLSSPVNDALLGRMANFAGSFCYQYPDLTEYVFQRPLIWNTELSVEKFTDGFVPRDEVTLMSTTMDVNGRPLATVIHDTVNVLQISVSCFYYIERVLVLIGNSQQLTEMRNCIQANPDPIANIVGEQFSSQNAPIYTTQMMEQLVNNVVHGGISGNIEAVKHSQNALKMLMILKAFDEQLLLESVKHVVGQKEGRTEQSSDGTDVVSTIPPRDLPEGSDGADHAEVQLAEQGDEVIGYFGADQYEGVRTECNYFGMTCPEPIKATDGEVGKSPSEITESQMAPCEPCEPARGYFGVDKFEGIRGEAGYFGRSWHSLPPSRPSSPTDDMPGYYGAVKYEGLRTESGYFGRSVHRLPPCPGAREVYSVHEGLKRSGSAPPIHGYFGANKFEGVRTEAGYFGMSHHKIDSGEKPEEEIPGYFGAEMLEGLRTEEGYFGKSSHFLPVDPDTYAGMHTGPGYFGADAFEGNLRVECDYFGPECEKESVEGSEAESETIKGYFGADNFEGSRDLPGFFGPEPYGAEDEAPQLEGEKELEEGELTGDQPVVEDFEDTEGEDEKERKKSVPRGKKRKDRKRGVKVIRRLTKAERSRAMSRPKKSVVDLWGEDSSSDDEQFGDEFDETVITTIDADHWYIQKLVKLMKSGNHGATIIAMCGLRDLNMRLPKSLHSFVDCGGLEGLVNILESNDIQSTVGSLRILREICSSRRICRSVLALGGVSALIELLHVSYPETQGLAAEIISQVARLKEARKIVRLQDGLSRLVSLLNVSDDFLDLLRYCSAERQSEPSDRSSGNSTWPGPLPAVLESDVPSIWRDKVRAARAAALALYTCAVSRRNRMVMRQFGVMPLLSRLMHCTSPQILIPVVGILKFFAHEHVYRTMMVSERMIADIVRTLNHENSELKMSAAFAIFRCAEDDDIRVLVRQYGALPVLAKTLSDTEISPDLLIAVTGAIWKLSLNPGNVEVFQKLGAMKSLTSLLRGQPEKVVMHVAGAVSEMTKLAVNRELFYTEGGLQSLLHFQGSSNPQLISNINNVIGSCSPHKPSMELIERMDGICHVWSMLKHPNPETQASAAMALATCIEHLSDSAEFVRSLTGGIELLVKQLNSDHVLVLASACAAIATIAREDETNLAIMTNIDVIPKLSRLVCTTDKRLMAHLSDAIAACSMYADNRFAFAKEGVVAPIVGFLKYNDINIQLAVVKALHELSKSPDSCIMMHREGVTEKLLSMIGADNPTLQESAAGCIYNIRRMALANEKACYKRKPAGLQLLPAVSPAPPPPVAAAAPPPPPPPPPHAAAAAAAGPPPAPHPAGAGDTA